jgi:hypothetical protein
MIIYSQLCIGIAYQQTRPIRGFGKHGYKIGSLQRLGHQYNNQHYPLKKEFHHIYTLNNK